jgi:hypothetical protein
VDAPLSFRDARRSAELVGACARHIVLAAGRGETWEASIAPGEQAGACSSSRVGATYEREGLVAAEARRGWGAGARGVWALPAGAPSSPTWRGSSCSPIDGACLVSESGETHGAGHAGLVLMLRQPELGAGGVVELGPWGGGRARGREAVRSAAAPAPPSTAALAGASVGPAQPVASSPHGGSSAALPSGRSRCSADRPILLGGLEPCCIRGAIVRGSPCGALGAPG